MCGCSRGGAHCAALSRRTTYMDVGSAELRRERSRPTYMDVGSAELCRERSRPTYMDVGSAELCRERSRPTPRGERNFLTDRHSLFTTHFHIR